jgi:hypothetical protein
VEIPEFKYSVAILDGNNRHHLEVAGNQHYECLSGVAKRPEDGRCACVARLPSRQIAKLLSAAGIGENVREHGGNGLGLTPENVQG